MNFKKTLILISLLTFGAQVHAQEKISSETLTIDWSQISQKDGVIISLKKEDCKIIGVDKLFTYGFIKIENTTNEAQNLQFIVQRNYTDGCVGCEHKDEYTKTVNIPANSTISAVCGSENSQLTFLINNPFQLDHKELVDLILIHQ